MYKVFFFGNCFFNLFLYYLNFVPEGGRANDRKVHNTRDGERSLIYYNIINDLRPALR